MVGGLGGATGRSSAASRRAEISAGSAPKATYHPLFPIRTLRRPASLTVVFLSGLADGLGRRPESREGKGGHRRAVGAPEDEEVRPVRFQLVTLGQPER